MPPLILIYNIVLLGLGGVLLYYGGEYLLRGCESIARKKNISNLVIGLTITAIGTSAPELFVSLLTACKGSSDISLGNIIGSNICNIALILGPCAILHPMLFRPLLRKIDLPVMMGSAVLLVVFYYLSHGVNRWEGLLLISGLGFYFWRRVVAAKRNPDPDEDRETEKEEEEPLDIPIAILAIIGGAIMLGLGSQAFVDSAKALSFALGFTEALTGLTVVAVGTSLPELFTSFLASKKGNNDLAIGNIVGSNICNVGLILGLVPIIQPLEGETIHWEDIAVMLGVSLALFLFGVFGKKKLLTRAEGIALFLTYLAYTGYLLCFRRF